MLQISIHLLLIAFVVLNECVPTPKQNFYTSVTPKRARGVIGRSVEFPFQVIEIIPNADIKFIKIDEYGGPDKIISYTDNSDSRVSIQRTIYGFEEVHRLYENTYVWKISFVKMGDAGKYEIKINNHTSVIELEIVESYENVNWGSHNLCDGGRECDPLGAYPCCNHFSVCTFHQCDCEDCVDYRKIYGINQTTTIMPDTVTADSSIFTERSPTRVRGIVGERVKIPFEITAWITRYDKYEMVKKVNGRDKIISSLLDKRVYEPNLIGGHDIIWLIVNATESDSGYYEFTYNRTYTLGFNLEIIKKQPNQRWDSSLTCGYSKFRRGEPDECDPLGAYPCCLDLPMRVYNYCGFTEKECSYYCGNCIDYRKVHANVTSTSFFAPRTPKKTRAILGESFDIPFEVMSYNSDDKVELTKLEGEESISLTPDARFEASTRAAESTYLWTVNETLLSDAGTFQIVVNGCQKSNIEVEVLKSSEGLTWSSNYTCNNFNLNPDVLDECDKEGAYPCCSEDGRCGFTQYYCKCVSCMDYREY